MGARTRTLLFGGIGSCALAVRVLALWYDRHSPWFESGGIDARDYLGMASSFWSGKWPGNQPFFWAPGYPMLLALLTAVSKQLVWLKLVQIALGTATTALVARLAWLLFGQLSTAALAFCIAAFYAPLIYYDIQLSPATLDVFLAVSLLVLLLECARRNDGRGSSLAAGSVAAASAVTRGGVLLFMPLALAWIFRTPGATRNKLARIGLFGLPVLGLVGLVAWHNYRHDAFASAEWWNADPASRGVVLISYNLGINFLLGNDPALYDTNDVEHPLCFVQYRNAMTEPERHSIATASAQSRFLVRKALVQVGRDPGAWLRLQGRKILELVHGEEISRDTNIYASRLENPVLSLLLHREWLAFPTGLLLPFALLGAFVGRAERRAGKLVAAFVCSQAAFLLCFFITTRYRLPLCAAAIPFAARGVLSAFEAVRASFPARERLRLVWLGALLLVCNGNLHQVPVRHSAFEYYHLGAFEAARGHTGRALQHWQRALALEPNYPTVYFEIADHYRKSGDFERAKTYFERGLRTAPNAYSAREDYAAMLLAKGRVGAAVEQLEIALRQAPGGRARQRACEMGKQARMYVSATCYEGERGEL